MEAHKDTKSIFIKINGISVIVEIREKDKIVERMEKICKSRLAASYTYRYMCKRYIPMFMEGSLSLENEMARYSKRKH